jgi:hypothetical protein
MLSVKMLARSLPEWSILAKMYPNRKRTSLLFKIVECNQKKFYNGTGWTLPRKFDANFCSPRFFFPEIWDNPHGHQ